MLLLIKSACPQQLLTHVQDTTYPPTASPSPGDSTGGMQGLCPGFPSMRCKAAPPAPPWSSGLQGTLGEDMVCLGVEQLGCFSDPCSSSFCLAAPAEQLLPLHTFSWLPSCSWRCPEEFFLSLVDGACYPLESRVVLPESGLLFKVPRRRQTE